MKRIFPAILLLFQAFALNGQVWDESYLNKTFNIGYGSLSPVRISDNAVRDYGVAVIDYALTRGAFYPIDGSGNAGVMSVTLDGLKSHGDFSLQGRFRYTNSQQRNQRWNSSLGLDIDNPFFVADSLSSDVTSEVFDLRAVASYRISDRLRAGLELGVKTGSRSDQSDPRPATETSSIPFTAGISYRLSPSLMIGASASASLFSSMVSFTNVQAQLGHRYFIMKGMGDYIKRSTSDESGYHRQYDGNAFGGALNALFGSGEGATDFVELSFSRSVQNARDGGASYAFKGGDFSKISAGFANRLQIKGSGSLHDVEIEAAFDMGSAVWSDQQRKTDMEHGGRVYYEILSTNTIESLTRLRGTALYTLTILGDDGEKGFYTSLGGGYLYQANEHYQGTNNPLSSFTMADATLLLGKRFLMAGGALILEAGGSYRLPLSREFASASSYPGADNITEVYCAHKFEYETASRASAHALADFRFKARKGLAPGIFVKGQYEICTGAPFRWEGYDGTSLTGVTAGAYITF